MFHIYNRDYRQFIGGSKNTKKGLATLIVALFLCYQGIIIGNFVDLSLEYGYALAFMIFLLAYLLYNKDNLRVNPWLLLSLFFALISLIIGLFMGWYVRDILADVARYVAPFIGFAAGMYLLRRLPYDKIIYFVIILAGIELLFYYYSVLEKIIYVYDGGPIIEYAKHGLEVRGFYFFLFVCFLKRRILSRLGMILVVGYIVGFIFSPIMLISKARSITMLFSLILVYLFIAKLKTRVIMISLFLICIFAGVKYLEVKSFSRVYATVEFLQSGEYSKDPSTAVRVAEIYNILDILNNALPYSLFFGMGSGALWFETVKEVKGGLHAGNFRDNGGLHDIFTMPVGYLFRYGIIGSVLILLWIGHVMKKLMKGIKSNRDDPFNYSICLSVLFYIFYAFLSDMFVPVYMYGNFHFGFLLAVACVVARYQLHIPLKSATCSRVYIPLKTATCSGAFRPLIPE